MRNIAFSDEERFARSYRRKAKEIVLAVILTRQHSKEQILEWYLNEVYYGNLAYGVEAAAQTLFGKSAAALNLAECALIAGLPQAPGTYDPLSPDPVIQARVKERQTIVLDRLLEEAYITPAQYDAAVAQQLAVNRPTEQERFSAPHFVVYVQSLLEDEDGPYISPKLLAQMCIRDRLPPGPARNGIAAGPAPAAGARPQASRPPCRRPSSPRPPCPASAIAATTAGDRLRRPLPATSPASRPLPRSALPGRSDRAAPGPGPDGCG